MWTASQEGKTIPFFAFESGLTPSGTSSATSRTKAVRMAPVMNPWMHHPFLLCSRRNK
jgi:hypothetical protein